MLMFFCLILAYMDFILFIYFHGLSFIMDSSHPCDVISLLDF